MTQQDKINNIFGSIFLVSLRLQNIGDMYLSTGGITTKQWLLLAVIQKFFNDAPTISEAATVLGSTRQNVKQLALKLEKRGFLEIINDDDDKRIQRLKITEECHQFWKKSAIQDNNFIAGIFKNLNGEEINQLYTIITKLQNRTAELLNAHKGK